MFFYQDGLKPLYLVFRTSALAIELLVVVIYHVIITQKALIFFMAHDKLYRQ